MTAAVFVLLSLALVLAAALLVILALGRRTDDERAPERVRDWLRASVRHEIEEARAAGDLRPEDLPRAESDLSRMVEAYGRDDGTARVQGPASVRIRVLLLVFFFATSAVLYGVYGGWHYIFFGPVGGQRHDLGVALHRYRRYLESHPDDVRGWRALARGYELLGHNRRAASAYRHLVRHGASHDPAVLADYAQALILAHKGRLDARELALTRRALALDPNQPKALWWGGLLALAVAHDRALALELWNRLLRNPALPSAVRTIVASRVVALGGQPARPASRGPLAAGPPVWTVRVTSAVAYAPAAHPRARLYVFLRNPLDPSLPPYYVRAVDHPAFPLRVTLSASDSPMGPPARLPREVELVALLSRDGRADPKPGDLEGRRLYTRAYLATGGRLAVRIDKTFAAPPPSGPTRTP